jgi:CrcB protein
MPSHKQAKHIGPADICRSTILGTLEEQQSNEARQQRSGSAANDTELTELAVAPPAAEDGIRDTYEKEEKRMKTVSSALQGSGQGDGELTECAVPAPISHRGPSDEEAGIASPTGPPRYQGFSESQNSSSTGVAEEEKQGLINGSSTYVEFCTISWLIFFAILGTLARLGVQAISTYPNAPFPSPVLWANLGASLLLGFLLEDRRFFRYGVEEGAGVQDPLSEIDRVKKTLPLYIGLATGFCGSFSSFSTFITDAFLALSNGLNSPSPTAPFHVSQSPIHARNGGYSFMATAGILIIQTAVSVGSLKAGAHMAVASEPILPSLPAAFLHRVLDPLSIPLGWGCWLGAALLTIWPPYDDWRYRATFAMVFAPPGAVLRFYLSKHLNARMPAFPLGTFTANIFGTIIEGMCMDLQHSSMIMAKVTGANAVPCAILEGVMSGFCGCTTTVSTWVAELNGLRPRHAWLYGLASVTIAMAFQVVIMGSMVWTIGYEQRCL